VLVWVFVMIFAFVGSMLGAAALLALVGFGDRASVYSSGSVPPEEGTVAGSAGRDVDLLISDARWEGRRLVVEGTWRGDVSSVHCDLLEGGGQGTVTDWWDRKGRTRMDWSRRSFSQEFYEARGREIEDPIDPDWTYGVACWALFSNGQRMGDEEAPVYGAPQR
jgi:hypothetical protein